MRETQLGGYDIVMTDFHADLKGEAIKTMVFMATSKNPIYLGPDTPSNIANQICKATGACGTNVEYLLKLCKWQKSHTKVEDRHLADIETHCLYSHRKK